MADSSGNVGAKWSSVSLITAVVLLIIVAGLGLYFQKRAANADELRIHTLEVLTEIESVRVEVAEISRSVRGYAISGKESWLEPYQKSKTQIPATMLRLRNLTIDNESQQQRLKELDEMLNRRIDNARKVVEMVADKKQAEAQKLIIDGTEGEGLTERINSTLNSMRAEEERLLKEREAIAENDSFWEVTISIVGNLIAIGIVIVAGLALTKTIRHLNEAAKKVEEPARRIEGREPRTGRAAVDDGTPA